MQAKKLTVLWAMMMWIAGAGVWAQQGDDPWARFRTYRQQLGAATQQGDAKAVERIRDEILDRETVLGVLVNLLSVDPRGGDLYFKKAMSLVENGDASADPAEALGARIDIYQQYAGFLGASRRHDEAEQWLVRSLKEVDSRVESWSRMAEGGPKPEAVAALRQMLPDLLRDSRPTRGRAVRSCSPPHRAARRGKEEDPRPGARDAWSYRCARFR